MDKNYTHITILLDASGSMQAIGNDMIGQLNGFIEQQQKLEGKATFTLLQFNTTWSYIYNMADLKDVKPVIGFYPNGGTALYDALGTVITDTGKALAALPEALRPSGVIVQVITDGEENSSHEYTASKVKEMIKHQEENYKWEFVYIGANVDSYANSASLGINNYLGFAATKTGSKVMMDSMFENTAMYRSVGSTAYAKHVPTDVTSEEAATTTDTITFPALQKNEK